MSGLYRASFQFVNENSTKSFDKYFSAEDDKTARKWFVLLAAKELEKEEVAFDEVIVTMDFNKVMAYYKDNLYLKVRLYNLPNKWAKVTSFQMKDTTFESILNNMKEKYPVRRGRSKHDND